GVRVVTEPRTSLRPDVAGTATDATGVVGALVTTERAGATGAAATSGAGTTGVEGTAGAAGRAGAAGAGRSTFVDEMIGAGCSSVGPDSPSDGAGSFVGWSVSGTTPPGA